MANGDLRDKIAQAGLDRGLDVPDEFAALEEEITPAVDETAAGAEQAVIAFVDTVKNLPDVNPMQVLKMVIDQLSGVA